MACQVPPPCFSEENSNSKESKTDIDKSGRAPEKHVFKVKMARPGTLCLEGVNRQLAMSCDESLQLLTTATRASLAWLHSLLPMMTSSEAC